MKIVSTSKVGILIALALAMLISLTPIFTFSPAQASSSSCKVTGLNKSSNAKLNAGLCKMSRALGPIEITSSCRTRKANRSVSKSYHLYNRGCKAADVVIKGVERKTILAWWAKNMGGGRGYYCGRRFVHVDVGPKRTWRWYCG